MSSQHRNLSRAVLALAVAGLGSGAFAASGNRSSATSESQQQYQQERAACVQGTSGQSRADCLREVEAARAEARRGELSRPASESANATARCDALSGDDKSDCIARMKGAGTTSGSVKGGGILREKRTVIPAGASTGGSAGGRSSSGGSAMGAQRSGTSGGGMSAPGSGGSGASTSGTTGGASAPR